MFEGLPVVEIIEQRIDTLARKSVRSLLASGTRVTSASLRRTIIAATELNDVPILIEAHPFVFSSTGNQMRATATIGFAGDPVYFACGTPTAPKLRTVRAAVHSDHIVISAYGRAVDREWLPTLLTAEIQAIGAYLAAQSSIVGQFNRTRKTRAAELTARIIANIERMHRRW